MLKKIIFLLLFSSMNCFASKPITCPDISQELNPAILHMMQMICKSSYFNQNIRFITNTTNVDVDEWIKKYFFMIINKKSNIVLSPYNTIFKQIAILPNASVVNYRNFVKSSYSQKLPNYSWLQQVNNISALISSSVSSINNMFNNTLSFNLQKNIEPVTTNNETNNNFLATNETKNSTSGVSDCNHIDPQIPLGSEIMIMNICNSKYFNKNIKFITNTSNVNVDKWIAKGFFIIIDKESEIVIMPYNIIFKQIAILPSADPDNYHQLFNFSIAQKSVAYDWLKQVNNTSSLIETNSFDVVNMFTGSQPYTSPTPARLTIDGTHVSVFALSVICIGTGAFFSVVAFFMYKRGHCDKICRRRNYNSI